MGYDYALVHIQYTIPPAIALTALYCPFFTSLDLYKVSFLVLIAVVATTPWDSYLIHNNIWTYPDSAVIGLTIFRIPLEEFFFFVIQTYNTTLLYLLLSKPTFHPVYLRGEKSWSDGKYLRIWKQLGQVALVAAIFGGSQMIAAKGRFLYLGLIITWACPFALLLWSLAYQFIIGLPLANTLIPIMLPTVYLWIVDTLALRRGTWVIESGTKTGVHMWEGLEIEEAIFFLATNVLIVFGQVAFDNALAILQAFPAVFPSVSSLPPPHQLVEALLYPANKYNEARLVGLRESLARLRRKSRSFYLASSVFPGRLRIDLILLYSFCRTADDLVDNAESLAEARRFVQQLRNYLNYRYGRQKVSKYGSTEEYICANFPASAHAALLLLPTSDLSPQPLYDLLDGFEMDLQFSTQEKFPIKDETALWKYASYVAGTVAELCIELVYHHSSEAPRKEQRAEIVRAGGRMGIALQLVNIARDIAVDAKMGRVYIPTDWLEAEGLSPSYIIENPTSPHAEMFRQRLLDHAMEIYRDSRGAIERLPSEARGPMRVAVESYMEIGRTLRTSNYKVKAGRATVPKWRRLQVAWKALSS
ncbi:hypothetical protein MMC25_007218 [Agyrium rufum]|nr:hypothetical protein [Agyrium rufum]